MKPKLDVRLIWHRDVAQRQSNVETTLCTSTLKFTTLNNVETTLYFLTLNWTTLGNVETTLSFSTSISQRWATSKQRCKYDHSIKPRFKSKIIFLASRIKLDSKVSSIFTRFKKNLLNDICRGSKTLKTSNILNNKKYI